MLQRVSMLQRELHQAVGTLERKLRRNIRPMRFDRPRADEKFGGDFFRRLLLGNGFQNPPFSRREVLQRGRSRRERFRAISPPQQQARQRRAHVRIAGCNTRHAA